MKQIRQKTIAVILALLVVFHTGGGGSKQSKGMYVWDGDKWQKVSYDL
jgi:hypothetical protein